MVTTPKPIFLAALTALLPALAACTFLVKFNDKEDDEADGGDASTPLVDSGGLPEAAPTGDAATLGCEGKADGFAYAPSDPLSRCCGGQRVRIDLSDNCGVCGFKCSKSQTCVERSGRYYCQGCVVGSTADDTLCATSTNCCSKQFDPKGLCSASTCIVGGSTCDQKKCSDHNAQCELPTDSSYACYYP